MSGTESTPDLNALLATAQQAFARGDHAAAQFALAALLAEEPDYPQAPALMLETLSALGAMRDAEPFFAEAIRQAPDNLRLEVLRGSWLLACGCLPEARACFAAILSRDQNRPGAWRGLADVALASADPSREMASLREWWNAMPRELWPAWRAEFDALFAAHDPQPQADPAHMDLYFAWVRAMQQTGQHARVLASIPDFTAMPACPERNTWQALVAESGRAAGDYLQVAALDEQAVISEPDNRAQWHRRLLDKLLAADLDGAEHVFANLLPRKAGDVIGVDLTLFNEARVHRSAIAAARTVLTGERSLRLSALGELLCAEPGSLLLALIWINAWRQSLASSPCIAMANAPGESLLPALLWHDADLAETWHARHGDFASHDLRRAATVKALRQLAPAGLMWSGLRALPAELRTDILRYVALLRDGGWAVPGARACHESLATLPESNTRLVVVHDDNGFLLTDLMACTPGDPAIRAALGEAVQAIGDTPPREGNWQLTGATALTLGVARTLAGRVLAGETLEDVTLLSQARLQRWLS